MNFFFNETFENSWVLKKKKTTTCEREHNFKVGKLCNYYYFFLNVRKTKFLFTLRENLEQKFF